MREASQQSRAGPAAQAFVPSGAPGSSAGAGGLQVGQETGRHREGTAEISRSRQLAHGVPLCSPCPSGQGLRLLQWQFVQAMRSEAAFL